MARAKAKHQSYIAVPSQLIHSLSASAFHTLHLSPRKAPRQAGHRFPSLARSPKFLLVSLFFLLALFRTLRTGSELDRLLPLSPVPCSSSSSPEPVRSVLEAAVEGGGGGVGVGAGAVEGEFWRQPDGMGYRPCLDFSEEYRVETEAARAGRRRKYLLVVVSGGLNQQRNQIVDAVVIARILGAALVVPVLQVNLIWGDDSEFSDIFDLEHFKRVLADDVKVVSSLPSTHIRTRPVAEKQTPLHVSSMDQEQVPEETATLLQPPMNDSQKELNREGVLLLRGLDSRLSKDLPSDLQKLRCKSTDGYTSLKSHKVAFHALRFAAPIQELGNKLAMRMRSKGPYLALHLRLEKDVWVRTGCVPGLSSEDDEVVQRERKLRPKLLTARSNMTYHQRKLAGFCPLNALEVTRLIKALGAPKDARIYWAGGEPFGGRPCCH
ncbi:DUF246 domain-containing protein [Musa troglodytarum]|uniref:O-fucosyltransferase family protein n=1 Tax=Musa troglodytarum TaxID=320322 RepID=A0A9E7KQB9_9LILI|nr:DUF246 domain-containing protein [Musa troglodytarum]